MNYILHVKSAFEKAEKKESKCVEEILSLEGMSGTKTRHLYNNLLNMEDARYLEIGTWKGSSVCSAMIGNSATITCIDNFSEFVDGNPRMKLKQNLECFKGKNKVEFLEEDCFEMDKKSLLTYNIYLYDGDHSKEAHYKALSYFYEVLDNTFIFIVDDWNWESVQQGTELAIQDLHAKILYKHEVKSSIDSDKDGYWNGVCVFVLQKS